MADHIHELGGLLADPHLEARLTMPGAVPPILVPAARLLGWMADVLVLHGLSDDHAMMVASALVDANLRGIDTHGVAQLPAYSGLLRRGATNPRPDIRVDEHDSIVVVHGDRGLGQVVGTLAIDRAMDAAGRTGCAVVTIRDVGHLGALGYFTRRAAEAGLVALLMQNGPPLMALPGSSRRAIGNNPLSFAAPIAGGSPLVFDMAASEASYGKVVAANAAGASLPTGWALNPEGQPTTDAAAALSGMLLPVAGAKGIGLAMMVQCLAGSLTGTRSVWGEGIFAGFLLIVRPDDLIEPASFNHHMADWLTHYGGSAPDSRIPGQRGDACRKERLAAGIPLPPIVAAALEEVGSNSGVPLY